MNKYAFQNMISNILLFCFGALLLASSVSANEVPKEVKLLTDQGLYCTPYAMIKDALTVHVEKNVDFSYVCTSLKPVSNILIEAGVIYYKDGRAITYDRVGFYNVYNEYYRRALVDMHK